MVVRHACTLPLSCHTGQGALTLPHGKPDFPGMEQEIPAMEQQFTVQGMSCGHCVRAVTAALQKADPAAMIQVDLGHKSVVVQSGTDRARLGEAITAAGYEVG